MLRPLSRGLAIAVILTSAFAAYELTRSQDNQKRVASASPIGGPFELVDQDGQRRTQADLEGKPSLLFFGFTHCPDVCPTTLGRMSGWLKQLGPDADKLNVAFISVDPERDTPKRMKDYLSAFDPHIRGLTGTPREIEKIAKEYRVYYRKIPLRGADYAMDHPTAIYMMDPNGRFIDPIDYGDPDTKVLPLLHNLVKG